MLLRILCVGCESLIRNGEIIESIFYDAENVDDQGKRGNNLVDNERNFGNVSLALVNKN